MEKNNSMIRLTGLWKNETKKGDPMLSGSISPSSNLVILPNKSQQGKGPDYIAYIAQPVKKEQAKQGNLF